MVLGCLITMGGVFVLLMLDYWRAWRWAERQVSSARKRADQQDRESAAKILQTSIRVQSGWRPTWNHTGKLRLRVSAHW